MSALAARALRPRDAERLAQARTVLHVSFGAEAAFHVHMWVPFISSVDPTFVIVVRSTGLFLRLRRHSPDLPVFLLRSGRDVAAFVAEAEGLRVVLYTSNSGNVLDFVRHDELRHVFIGHGDSDKVASINRFFRLYDENWVSGQAQIDRIQDSGNVGPGQLLRVVGRPAVRSLLDGAPGDGTELPIGVMPTWEGPYDGQNYTSSGHLADIVQAAASATERPVVVKVHPWTGRRDRTYADVEQDAQQLAEAKGIDLTITPRSAPADSVMSRTAALISDVSSITADYLLTGRPIFVYLPPALAARVRSGAMPLTDYAYPYASVRELHELLESVMGGDDPLADSRARARDYLIDVEATAGRRFEAFLGELVDGEPA